MALENVELRQWCYLEAIRMGTARMQTDKDKKEDCKQRRVNMKSKVGTKKPAANYSLWLPSLESQAHETVNELPNITLHI